MFFFLKDDFDKLNQQIEEICEKIKKLGQEMGKSCQEGAETYHDNFAYEDSERQQFMWSSRLRELIKIRNNTRVVTPDTHADKVSIGRLVTFLDNSTEVTKTLTIGSYMVLRDQNEGVISYNAPLARILIGAKEGDLRDGLIAGKEKSFKILKII